MRTALVTGAAGLVGAALARALAAAGWRVRLLVRRGGRPAPSPPTPLPEGSWETWVGDVASGDGLAAAMRGCEVVFHTAGRLGDHGGDDEYFAVNAGGAAQVAAAATAAGVRRLVHASSLAVLGLPRDGRLIDELAPLAPRPDAYSRSKAAAEARIRGAGCETVIVRPGAIWGRGDRTFLPRLSRLLRLRLLPWIGDGWNRLGVVHVDDVAAALAAAADAPLPSGAALHITDGRIVTQRDLVAAVARALSLPLPRLALPLALLDRLAAAPLVPWATPLSPLAIDLLACDARYDISRARQLLAWSPTRFLTDAAARGL